MLSNVIELAGVCSAFDYLTKSAVLNENNEDALERHRHNTGNVDICVVDERLLFNGSKRHDEERHLQFTYGIHSVCVL
jgi:hypothetical protein